MFVLKLFTLLYPATLLMRTPGPPLHSAYNHLFHVGLVRAVRASLDQRRDGAPLARRQTPIKASGEADHHRQPSTSNYGRKLYLAL